MWTNARNSPNRLPWLGSFLALLLTTPVASEEIVQIGAEVVGEAFPGIPVEVDLRDLPLAPDWKPGDPIREVPKRTRPPAGTFEPEPSTGPDPLLDAQSSFRGGSPAVTVVLNQNGQSYTSVNPPDTVGDVGPNHYIQMINASGGAQFVVYNKTTGAVLAGPTFLDSLGTGNCSSGAGDPIVLYDPLADRWFLSEFSSGGNRLCLYVSRGPNPITDGWCHYQVTAPTFPDYPKYGVWSDAYYVTTNENVPAIYALDRENMILGTPTSCATMRAAQRFSVPPLSGFGFQALTPADLDGLSSPPVNAPGLLLRHRDTEVHGPAGNPSHDLLEMWELDVDWNTPANSVLTQLASIQIAEIDSDLCGLTSFNCFPQPGSGTTLDPLREVIMFRLAYRNFGSHQALVGNLVTDVTGTNRGGKRWFELRKTGSNWVLHQEGTYSPNATHRWMGAIAMDGDGNILLGYNVSDATTVFPGLRFTGRLAGDPLGTMTLTEQTLVAGTAANGSNRYGDYSAMSIDPADECTFWFTGEWNAASQWSTRIGAIRFDDCGGSTFFLNLNPSAAQICAGNDSAHTVQVGSIGGYNLAVTLSNSALPGSATANYSTNPVPPPGASTLTIGNTGTIPPGSYTITVQGTGSDSQVKSANLLLEVFSGSPASPSLVAPAAFATDQPLSVPLSWNAVGGAASYLVQVDDQADFSSPVFTSTTSGTSAVAVGLLADTRYYWRVRAANPCGPGTFSPVRQFRTASSYCRTPNVAIPDNNPAGVSDTLSVTGSGTILDLDVYLRIAHTWVGDVRVQLTRSPTTRAVFDRPGVPGSTYGCSGDNVNATFSDEASLTAETSCSNSTGLTTGPYSPNETLSVFDALTLAGTWTLNAADFVSSDTGTLQEWCLIPTLDRMPFSDDFETGNTSRWSFEVIE